MYILIKIRKVFLFTILILFSLESFSQEQDRIFSSAAMSSVCKEAMSGKSKTQGLYFSQSTDFTLIAYRLKNTQWKLVRLNHSDLKDEEILEINENIYAIKIYNRKIWVLLREEILVLDEKTYKPINRFKTHTYSFSVSEDYRAYDMEIYQGILYVSHGGSGLHLIDPNTGRLLSVQDVGLSFQIGGYESKIVSALLGSSLSLVVAVPMNSVGGFNGLVQFNTENFNKPVRFPYQGRRTEISPQTRIKQGKAEVLLSNGGVLQVFKAAQFQFKAPVIPRNKKIEVTYKGKLKKAEVWGDFIVENKKVYGCGRIFIEDSSGQPKYLGVVLK